MKNQLTQARIEPATFRFVAQHLNHCATAAQKYGVGEIHLFWMLNQAVRRPRLSAALYRGKMAGWTVLLRIACYQQHHAFLVFGQHITKNYGTGSTYLPCVHSRVERLYTNTNSMIQGLQREGENLFSWLKKLSFVEHEGLLSQKATPAPAPQTYSSKYHSYVNERVQLSTLRGHSIIVDPPYDIASCHTTGAENLDMVQNFSKNCGPLL